MSVMITMKFPISADVMEKTVNDHREMIMSITQDGQRQGLIHHQFAEDSEGNALVVDEWPDEETFQRFFAGQEDIKKVLAAAGVMSEPVVTVCRIIDTPDRV
ncbi:hypothetical protein Acsp06_36570 [Actinomycetospora sp. NBRC 106375]|uniref:hypothetical protein n=1 Tax=Actinomycetospora sp. NBRC 106375 TaxID=3032207 RepID=UPI0024A012A1|nr:hypothetical protein [Actinomycetospora sp. NBRC 106375]GLZ47472.1 hypothetical protein Acsp06_36570 [Actinomycetospora sp. NBRC 106375]